MSMKTFVVWLERKTVEEVKHILHLPLIERLMHRSSRRPLIAIVLSIVIMIVASTVAHSKEWLSHHSYLPAVFIDAMAYLAHGLGAIPIVRYAEPVWALFFGAVEVAAETAVAAEIGTEIGAVETFVETAAESVSEEIL